MWLALTSLALFESIAVAVHFEDVDVVGQSVEQRTGQPLGPEHAGPLVEWQIAGEDGGAALGFDRDRLTVFSMTLKPSPRP